MFEDERGTPRHPVTCRQCGVRVLVKKNSLAHTVVQWTTTTEACGELSSGDTSRPLTATCSFLRDSIDTAVRTHELEVAEPIRERSAKEEELLVTGGSNDRVEK